ncbi:hypothetical protein OSB04_027792 [Centaurea solstitialis]|uniref:Uncharacterized protein n=1 Tax=Centaurea solstitialis TaxID=347529 RepID=A0AA38SRG4_9ASTR|nr:hypothetical protein OSB04_027792 [Centaurea solstitialis]
MTKKSENNKRFVPRPVVEHRFQRRKTQPKRKGNKKGFQKKEAEKSTSLKIVAKWVPKTQKESSSTDKVVTTTDTTASSVTTASTDTTANTAASSSNLVNATASSVNTASCINTAPTAASSSNSGTTTANQRKREPILTTKYSSHDIPSKEYLLKLKRLTEIQYGNPDRNENLWHVDSGCSRHMTGNMSYLEDFLRFNGGYVAFGDNPKGGKISGKGKVTGGKLTLEEVYYVDQLRYNLLSVSQVCDKKYYILFSETECIILSSKFKVDESLILLRTPRRDNVYCLDLNGMPSEVVNCLFSKASVTESSLWHRRMGHTNMKTMNILVKNNLVRGLPQKEFTLDDNCVACLKGKQHKASHKSKTINTVSAPLQLLYMDLFGPTNVMSIGKKSYCLVIIDDYSRFTWVFFLRTKDETSGLIKPFVIRIENQTNLRVKVIRSDNGTEFKNADLNSFCEDKGIERQFSAPRTPQQNGVAERRNRTLIEAARTMLADSKLPITFWAEAVNTACYVQNRVLVVKSKGNTPYELFKKKKPFVGFFVPFGTIEESDNVKFNENTPNVPGSGPDWLFDIDSLTNSLNMSSAVVTGPSTEAQDTSAPFVMFPTHPQPQSDDDKDSESEEQKDASEIQEDEHEAADPQPDSQVDNETRQTIETEQHVINETEADDSNLGVQLSEEPLYLTRTQKNHPPSLVIGDMESPMITRKQSKANNTSPVGMISCFLSQTEPKKAYDAMKDPSWIEAMQEELLQFVLQHVWDLVDLPWGHRVIGTKWIFRNKTDEREGIDYDDVFAPVARIEAIRLFLAFASYKGFKVYQMDVKSAFLYGTIDEEVYVSQPPGFEDPDYPDRVYKLRKALYGLHQAPRAWYDTLSTYLLENEFERGVIDKTLFIRRTKNDVLLVQIYVDDIIFGSTDDKLCKELEELMHKKFKMSSMGELTFFLGLQVKQKPDGIFLNQSKYVASMLQKFGMTDAKPASTPMETHKQLTADVEGEEVDVHHYRSMIGSLMYLTASRPDIMFAVCQPRLGLWYPKDSSFDLVEYTDSDYGGANLDRKSTSGGCQFLGSRLVSWQCKKQTTVSQSTTEAEYIASSSCCSQVLWIQNQTPIYIDNNSAISIVNNPVKHSKTKHIEIRFHFIRDCNEKKLIQVLKVHTDNQFADLFTKAFDEIICCITTAGDIRINTAGFRVITTASSLKVTTANVSVFTEDQLTTALEDYHCLNKVTTTEVVENGPGVDEAVAEGGARPPPISDADRKRRQTEMKALSTLLLAIPNEYQHQFSTYTDAKSLWTALEKRFSGTKSTKRNQKAILKQQYENFTSLKNESMTQTFDRFNKLIGELATVDVKMDKDDVNRKFLRSLGEEWTIYTVSFRQGDNLEDKELEDLYNDLRIFEAEVEKKKRPIGYTHNTALLSENPNSFNTTAFTNTTAAYNTTANETVSNINSSSSQETNEDTVLEAFLASHVKSSLINDDLDQINADDLEEMDIKWQMAMLTLRMKRFIRRTGRNNFDLKRGDKAGFDKSKVRCYKCNEPGHFARECKGVATNNQTNGGGSAQAPRFNNRGSNSNPSSSQALVSQEGQGFDWSDHAEEAVQNQALMAEIKETDVPTEVSSKLCSDLCLETVKKYRDHNQTMSDSIKKMERERREYVKIIDNLEDQIKAYKANELQFEYDHNYWKWEKKELERNLAKEKEEVESARKELSKAKEDLDKFSKSSKALESIIRAQVTDDL